MASDEIIRMAREAGCVKEDWLEANTRFLARFAAIVVAAKREACIALCEEHWKHNGNAMECADAIRAKGEK